MDVVARGEFLPTMGTTTTTTTTTDIIGSAAYEKVVLIVLTLASWLESHSVQGFGVYQRFCRVSTVPLRIVALQLAAARVIISYRLSKHDS